MTEELKAYLVKSKPSRKKLRIIAKSYEKCLNTKSNHLKIKKKIIDFPDISPMRFKSFEEMINKDLQKIFNPKQSFLQKPKKRRCLSYNKKRINSVIDLQKPAQKNLSFLPSIKKFKKLSVPNLPTEESLIEKASDLSTRLSSSPKKTINSRANIKKMLLIPVLKLKSNHSFEL